MTDATHMIEAAAPVAGAFLGGTVISNLLGIFNFRANRDKTVAEGSKAAVEAMHVALEEAQENIRSLTQKVTELEKGQIEWRDRYLDLKSEYLMLKHSHAMVTMELDSLRTQVQTKNG
jgi:hypothetical protein